MPPSSNEPPGEIPFSPRAKGTLEAALRQAMGFKDDFVDTEHILLALLIERDGRTASVFALLGAPARPAAHDRDRGARPKPLRRPPPGSRPRSPTPPARSPRPAARARPTTAS